MMKSQLVGPLPGEMEKINLEGMVDTHIHTSPDIKPRILSDLDAAKQAHEQKMKALVFKCHVESTVSRAQIAAKNIQGVDVFGGICLNSSVGGMNPDAVQICSQMGGKIVWLPTISAHQINIDENLEDILNIVSEGDMVLGTGHQKPGDIFKVLDMANSMGIKRILINHPLTKVVGATLDEQKEMAKFAYLEHCLVACMPQHDGLNPKKIAEAIKFVGHKKCVMATDFGQVHNPVPVEGLKLFISLMKKEGISNKHIDCMCSINPLQILK